MPCCAEQPELQRCRQQSHKAQEQEGTYPSALYFIFMPSSSFPSCQAPQCPGQSLAMVLAWRGAGMGHSGCSLDSCMVMSLCH